MPWRTVGEATQWAKAEGGKLEDSTKQLQVLFGGTSQRKHHQRGVEQLNSYNQLNAYHQFYNKVIKPSSK